MQEGAHMDREAVGTADLGRLHVEVREFGRTAVFTPSGELDHHTADVLGEPLGAAVDAGATRLVIDCAGLEFCDSTGLNVLLSARLRVDRSEEHTSELQSRQYLV